MNSSLQRYCASRARYIHVSKPIVIEKVELLPAHEIGGIAYPAITIERPVVSPDRGTTRGTTAALGVRKTKRLFPGTPHGDMRAFKDAAWDACRQLCHAGR